MAEKLTHPRQRMVEWYDPVQLVKTGVEIVVSSAFASRADYRLIEALGGERKISSYDEREEMWVDFLADTGDGWNSTYAMASLLAEPTLTVGGHTTQRGDVLVLGGDQVYPVASRDAYEQRFVGPYDAAL